MEGNLIAPWADELKGACERARADGGRELIVEMRNLVSISQEGENLLLALMNEGVKFRAHGVFAKHILKQLAERTRREVQGHKLATSQRTLNQSEQ
ncbi:MAG: hypothetical protein WAM13_00880 [Candidatus Sulfotelmatobacter sp.]